MKGEEFKANEILPDGTTKPVTLRELKSSNVPQKQEEDDIQRATRLQVERMQNGGLTNAEHDNLQKSPAARKITGADEHGKDTSINLTEQKKTGRFMSALKSVVNAINPFKSSKSYSAIPPQDSNKEQPRDTEEYLNRDSTVHLLQDEQGNPIGTIQGDKFTPPKQTTVEKAKAMRRKFSEGLNNIGDAILTSVGKVASRVLEGDKKGKRRSNKGGGKSL